MPRLAAHGSYSPASVSWNSKETQDIRFKIITELIPDKENPYTLLDIGCGVGDYFGYLQQNGYKNINYQGIDILPEMIQAARNKYPQAVFQTAEFLSRGWQDSADYLVSSGVLNMLFGDKQTHEEFIKKFVCKMYAYAKRGVAFNMLSEKGRAEFVQDELFYYAEPAVWQKFCREITQHSFLAEGYLSHDFTIFMAKPKATEKITETK